MNTYCGFKFFSLYCTTFFKFRCLVFVVHVGYNPRVLTLSLNFQACCHDYNPVLIWFNLVLSVF